MYMYTRIVAQLRIQLFSAIYFDRLVGIFAVAIASQTGYKLNNCCAICIYSSISLLTTPCKLYYTHASATKPTNLMQNSSCYITECFVYMLFINIVWTTVVRYMWILSMLSHSPIKDNLQNCKILVLDKYLFQYLIEC